MQEVLAALQDCQQVVCLEDIFEDSQWVYIVQELCEGGDLAEGLKVLTTSTASIAALLQQDTMIRHLSTAMTLPWCLPASLRAGDRRGAV